MSRGNDVFADTSALPESRLIIDSDAHESLLRGHTTLSLNTHGEDDEDDPLLMHRLRVLDPVANSFAGCGRMSLTFRTSLVGRSRLHLGFHHRLVGPQPAPPSGSLGSLRAYSTPAPLSPTPKPSLWSRMFAVTAKDKQSASSFRKIVALAKPEKKPLTFAVGLLLVSSSVSMSIPFTVGKLIDYFTSTHPVSFNHVIAPSDSSWEIEFPANPLWAHTRTSIGNLVCRVHYRCPGEHRARNSYADGRSTDCRPITGTDLRRGTWTGSGIRRAWGR